MTEVPGRGVRRAGTSSYGPYFAGPDDSARYLWFGNSVVRILFDAAATGGQFSLVENNTSEPFASPLHVHDVEDEAFIVLSGRIRAWVGDDRRDVDAGGVALLPHGVPHAFRVMSRAARFFVLAVPGGLEQLYQSAGHDLRDPVPEGWAVSVVQLAASEAKRNNRILGPPPGVDDQRAVPPAQ